MLRPWGLTTEGAVLSPDLGLIASARIWQQSTRTGHSPHSGLSQYPHNAVISGQTRFSPKRAHKPDLHQQSVLSRRSNFELPKWQTPLG
jgi:hypothetical protein